MGNWKNIAIVAVVIVAALWMVKKFNLFGSALGAGASAANAAAASVAAYAAASAKQILGLSLDQNTSGVTKTTGTAAVMTDLAVWAVPRKAKYIFRQGVDTISAYLKDAGAEALGTDAVQLVKRAPAGVGMDQVIWSGSYTQIKEFQDRTKMLTFPTTVELGEDWKLVLQGKITTVTVVASCYYTITGVQEITVG